MRSGRGDRPVYRVIFFDQIQGLSPRGPPTPSLAGPQDPRSAPAGAPVARLSYIHAPTSLANVERSMLPPETTATTLRRPARPLSAAAMAHPAAPSAITCARSAANFIASAASSRVTTREPVTCASSGHIEASTDLPPAPSTND